MAGAVIASSGAGVSMNRSISRPISPATTEARKMPTLACVSSASSTNDSSVTNSATVKPMPAIRPTATTPGQVTPDGSSAPKRTAIQMASATPRGFPMSSPSPTPRARDEEAASPNAPPRRSTPAFTKAKSGTMTNADHGSRRCSMRSSGEIACSLRSLSVSRAPTRSWCAGSSLDADSLARMRLSRASARSGSAPLRYHGCNGVIMPSATPRMVGWTPDSCAAIQPARPTTM